MHPPKALTRVSTGSVIEFANDNSRSIIWSGL
jgi:hypothetical protein